MTGSVLPLSMVSQTAFRDCAICTYTITNRITGNFYVGTTKSGMRRIYRHLQSLRINKHYSKCMQHEFNLYGIDAFYVTLFYAPHKNFWSEQFIKYKTIAENIEHLIVSMCSPKFNTVTPSSCEWSLSAFPVPAYILKKINSLANDPRTAIVKD